MNLFSPTRLVLGTFTAVAAVALFAGCSGSSSPVTPQAAPALQAAPGHLTPAVKNHCPAHGGVRVDPCTVTFDASSGGPDTVTVRSPKGKKGSLTESDDCGGPSGIATVTAGTGTQWTVTAGSTAGTCTATFSYTNHHGKVVGHADLDITNNI